MRTVFAVFQQLTPFRLPAVGIVATAVLYVFVAHCLLAPTGIDKRPLTDYRARTPAEKEDDRKKKPVDEKVDHEKKVPAEGEGDRGAKVPLAELVGVRAGYDLGTVNDLGERFAARSTRLDVQARRAGFLTAWAVANLVQGCLTLAVLAISVQVLRERYRHNMREQLRWVLIVTGASASAVVGFHLIGFSPLSMGGTALGDLGDEAILRLGLYWRVKLLTAVGNVSVFAVSVTTPLALSSLLLSRQPLPKRFHEFQRLMYWTSFLLVSGAIQVAYQNRIAGLLFDDEFNVQHIGRMAAGTGLLIGGIFSVALGLVFLPAGYALGRLSEAEAAPSASSPERNWLTEIAAVVAPALSALPLAKLFDIVT